MPGAPAAAPAAAAPRRGSRPNSRASSPRAATPPKKSAAPKKAAAPKKKTKGSSTAAATGSGSGSTSSGGAAASSATASGSGAAEKKSGKLPVLDGKSAKSAAAKATAPAAAPAAAPASAPLSAVDVELQRAEALLAAGDAEGALAIMAALEGGAGGAPKPPLKRASTVPANLGKQPPLPRGGTLVKLSGMEAVGLGPYEGRMGRVVEMNGRQFMEDGRTELCTVLLDSRVGDYARADGVWIGVPIANLKIQ